MKRSRLSWLVVLTQAIGTLFFAVFLASYALALPSNQVLHEHPIFRVPLSIFGGLFLTLTTATLLISFIVKTDD